ncbi:MAG: hypothetical protein COA50_03885 [Flavobacteriaceae bacterium]|nr:MAG: hypothetical protein COA50_03885 [Flavobacteriaceae bacterium]
MNKIKILIGVIVIVFIAIVSCKDAKNEKVITEEKVETYANQETHTSCLADPAWFTIDSSTGMRKTPAPKEDSNSVFGNNATVTNCNFHQWSWQKFLWLTNDVSGNPFFMENLIQVDNQTVPVANGSKKIVLTSLDNAQATGDILRTNETLSSDNTSYDVYYSIHVDSTLYESIQKYAPMDKSEYVEATFPVGALELKIAWVDARAIEDTSSYFVTDAIIGKNEVQIALLGMHVVGIVYNHPEFVWATFEHHDLVPYYDWEATTTSDIPVTSQTDKLLFSKDATGTIDNLASKGTHDNPNVFAVNQFGVPRQAENAFLATSQDGAENFKNMESINNSVGLQLTDIWNNYFYNGSIWIDTEGYAYPTEQAQLLNSLGSNLGNSAPGELPRGSVAAYNITMETYEQLGFTPPTYIYQQSVATMGNCFSCHSASNGSPLNISHIFNGAVHHANGHSREETKQMHLDEIKEFIKNMK